MSNVGSCQIMSKFEDVLMDLEVGYLPILDKCHVTVDCAECLVVIYGEEDRDDY